MRRIIRLQNKSPMPSGSTQIQKMSPQLLLVTAEYDTWLFSSSGTSVSSPCTRTAYQGSPVVSVGPFDPAACACSALG